MQTINALRALTLAAAALAAGASMAAEPLLIAKASVTRATAAPAVLRAAAPVAATNALHVYPSLGEAEQIGMGYAQFDEILAEVLNNPTAAGPMSVRARIEAAAASRMGGLMP